MDDFLLKLHRFGLWKARVTFGITEINLYRYNDQDVEVWFNIETNTINEIKIISGSKFNPYLKYVNKQILN